MNLFRFLLVFSVLILGLLSGLNPSYSQTNSCDSILLPRLRIGGRGLIQTESVILKKKPTSSSITILEEYDNFNVIAGPECHNDGNWWYVESDGFEGWILEGNSEQGYFVSSLYSYSGELPLLDRTLYLTDNMMGGTDVMLLQARLNEIGYDTGPIDGWFGTLTETAVLDFQRDKKLVVDGVVGPNTWQVLWYENEVVFSDCTNTPLSQLQVGSFVQVTTDIQISALYEEAVGAASLQPSQHPIVDQGKSLYVTAISISEDESLFLSEGPICYRGDYVWRIRRPTTIETNDYISGYSGYFWVFETFQGEYLLNPQNVNNIYTESASETVYLTKENLAPIVSPEVQLGFTPGGGSYFSPNDVLYLGGGGGLFIPFPDEAISETVEVKLIQPDGTIHSEFNAEVEAQQWGSSGIIITRPYLPGEQLGRWRVEINSDEYSRHLAYTLDYYPKPQLWPNKYAGGWSNLCIEEQPAFVLTGFNAHEIVEIVQVSDIGASSYKEAYRWEVMVSKSGDALIYPDFEQQENYYLIVANGNGNWQEMLEDSELMGDSDLSLAPVSTCTEQ